ncbi:MAG: hypothetical protein IT260_11930 [Saprospiraceae bacterium]|nr:hypothetical protein [Saprospiraceae bacterium]
MKHLAVSLLLCCLPALGQAQPSPVFGFQTGFSPRKGEFYWFNGNGLYNHLHAGLHRRVALGIGYATQYTETNGFNQFLKIGLLQRGKWQISTGGFGSFTWFRGERHQRYWMAYAAGTLGSRTNYIGGSLGYFSTNTWSYYSGGDGLLFPASLLFFSWDEIDIDINISRSPFAGLHLRRQLIPRTAFMLEAFFYPINAYEQAFILSPALQTWKGGLLKFDFAVSCLFARLQYSESIYFRPIVVFNLQLALGKRTRALWREDKQ